LRNPAALPATRLLATLVAADILEVKIAFADHPSGIFHDKLGIFEDIDGHRVTFIGSTNETWAAWGLNHESFEVFRSWQDESELLRTRTHAEAYQALWRDQEVGVHVESLASVTRDKLLEVAEENMDLALNAARSYDRPHTDVRTLLPHQLAVVEDWIRKDHHGVVNFATGAGKTLTAIEAIKRWTADGSVALVLVPGRDIHRQWAQELEDTLPACQLLLAGAGADPLTWLPLLPIFSARTGPAGISRVILVTNATFAGSDFRSRLRAGSHLFIVADEMHRVGAPKTLEALESVSCGATMGLSATYERQYDLSGTGRLLAFFGPVLEPVVGLAEAIAIGLLVPYDYRLHTLTPDDDELEQYEVLTKQIARLVAQNHAMEGPNDYLLALLIKRARLLKQARGKVPRAASLLEAEYKPGDRWLVYCDDLNQLNSLVDACIAAGLPTLEFYSGMPSDRRTVLNSLSEYGGIVVAIRCLDEGVDIPVTDHALILASSAVGREYIQRRGRVLRKAPDKTSAEIHDLLLVDEHGGALTRSEASRAIEFVRLARNPGARERLHLLLALSPDASRLPALEVMDDEEEKAK
jgi:superfamily II DNA or RNA helicase